MRSRMSAAMLSIVLFSGAATAQTAPVYFDCALTAADGKRSDVHYRLTGMQLLQFDDGARDYTIADFARQTCAVTAVRISCTRETRAPSLPNPVIRRLEIDRGSGAIVLSVTGLVYAAFDAKGICTAGVDRVTGATPERPF